MRRPSCFQSSSDFGLAPRKAASCDSRMWASLPSALARRMAAGESARQKVGSAWMTSRNCWTRGKRLGGVLVGHRDGQADGGEAGAIGAIGAAQQVLHARVDDDGLAVEARGARAGWHAASAYATAARRGLVPASGPGPIRGCICHRDARSPAPRAEASMSRLFRIAALWLCVALLAPWPPLAQSGAASITGLIVDETGGALPGVVITATSQASGVTYSATSNEAGNYTIPALLVGTYAVKAELSGFRTASRSAVTLEARQVARLDFRMAVGAVQETVEVTGRLADPADRVDRRRRGDLGQHGAVAAAERPQHRPAGAAAARHHHLQPARLHQHRQRQHEPAVRQRQPRADQQLHRRRPRRQRDHRQPRRLPAEPRRAGRDQRRDQQLHAPTPATSAARSSPA